MSPLVLVLLAIVLAQAPAAEGEPLLREIGDGVFVALQPEDRRFNDSNVVVFVGERALLVVDAPTDAELVRSLAAEIRARFDRPVRYLVNTHWHGDHTQGNAGFRDAFDGDVVIVGHRSLLDDVPGRAQPALAEQVATLAREIPAAEERLRRGVRRDGSPLSEEDRPAALAQIERARSFYELNRDARFLAPALTFDDTLRLDLGGLEVELLHFTAHTRGDVAVWAAARGVLAAGDVVDDMPYVGHGYPTRWAAALGALSALGPKLVAPGHGPVFEGTEQIGRLRGYLEALSAAAEAARAAGRAEAAKVGARFDAARWRAELARDERGIRFYDAVLEEAFARALDEEALAREELAGEPPP